MSASHKKTPYASQLFGDTPQETLEGAAKARGRWLPRRQVRLGADRARRVESDERPFRAAREGLGPDGILLVDVGQIWGEDVDAAAARLPALEAAGAFWLEEPFHASALEAYGRSPRRSSQGEDRRRRGRRTTSPWRGI